MQCHIFFRAHNQKDCIHTCHHNSAPVVGAVQSNYVNVTTYPSRQPISRYARLLSRPSDEKYTGAKALEDVHWSFQILAVGRDAQSVHTPYNTDETYNSETCSFRFSEKAFLPEGHLRTSVSAQSLQSLIVSEIGSSSERERTTVPALLVLI